MDLKYFVNNIQYMSICCDNLRITYRLKLLRCLNYERKIATCAHRGIAKTINNRHSKKLRNSNKMVDSVKADRHFTMVLATLFHAP